MPPDQAGLSSQPEVIPDTQPTEISVAITSKYLFTFPGSSLQIWLMDCSERLVLLEAQAPTECIKTAI